MADAVPVREWDEHRLTAGAAVAVGELWQMPSGAAAYYERTAGGAFVAGNAGEGADFRSGKVVTLNKATGIALLAGGRVYWDHSANLATFRKVHDRDFYVGRAEMDAASADPTVQVRVGHDPAYDLDLLRDAYVTAPVGTQALGGFLPPQRNGGALTLKLSATSEAQKVDALGKDGFSKDANAIVEIAFAVTSNGAAGAQDVSIGVANATHPTDADSITDSVLVHLNGGDTNIYFESDDGTTEVAAIDSGKDYVAGATNRVEVWMDFRNPAHIKMYVQGEPVLTGTLFNVNASVAVWKLLAHLEKTTGVDVFELDIDWARVRFMEQ